MTERRPGDARREVAEPGLPLAFFARDAETVARELLGKTLVRETSDRRLEARIVETEAYVGSHDLACHASRGLTPRTRVMFGPPGRAYVYLIYGMHCMLNVVVSVEGDPQAVLVRAAEPLGAWEARLDGPGRLTRAMAIGLELNACDLRESPLWIADGRRVGRVGTSARIGVDYAGTWAAAPLRFFDADSPAVARGR